MARLQRRFFLLAQVVFAAAIVWFAGRTLAQQWSEVAASGVHVELRWLPLAGASLIVLLTYAILVETWRRVVASWGGHLRWPDAARIWFVSNLGRYIPGKVWQIGAMGIMAQRKGVSLVAATGSAIVINLVSLLAGFGVVAITGARLLPGSLATWGAVLLLAGSVVLAPFAFPMVIRLAERLTGKRLEMATLPRRALWIALVGSVVAWLLYGVAFQLFVAGTVGSADGSLGRYTAAWVASYLIGYIILFAPGGIVVRETALVTFLTQLGLTGAGDAALIAVASRLWLTVLEIVPGAFFLARDASRAPFSTPTDDVPPS